MLAASARLELTTPAWRNGKFKGMPCPTPDCPGHIAYSTGTRLAFHACQVCRASVCVTCHRTLEQHENAACDNTVSQYINRMDGRVKKCPDCGSLISHEGGCNTMICESCGMYFCWLCGTLMCHRSTEHAYEIAHNHFRKPSSTHPDRGMFCRPGCEDLLFGNSAMYLARPGNEAYTGE